MAFDLLVVEGVDIRNRPLSERLDLLGVLFAEVSPPLQMVPTIPDVAVARGWLDDNATTPGLGMEGVVIKAAAGRYIPGSRGWLKYRIRQTYDVVVGAVVGAIEAPTRLVFGYHTLSEVDMQAGVLEEAGLDGPALRLQVAGASIPLGRRQARTIGALLHAADPGTHPCPDRMPARWLGDWASDTTRLRHVQPLLVVEVSADTAFEHGRWRHQVRYMRVRTDKAPTTVRRPDAPGPRTP